MSAIENNPLQSRFELAIKGGHEIAAAYYRLEGERVVLTHAIVPERFSGQGLGTQLAHGVFDEIRASGRKAMLVCPFMTAFYARHPAYADAVDDGHRQGELS